jgi:hypothetical protein
MLARAKRPPTSFPILGNGPNDDGAVSLRVRYRDDADALLPASPEGDHADQNEHQAAWRTGLGQVSGT